MKTISKIQEIIKRHRELSGAIETGALAIEKVKQKGVALVSPPQATNVLAIPAEVMLPIMEKQVQDLRNELHCIDKQLDAIGALMGVKDEPSAS